MSNRFKYSALALSVASALTFGSAAFATNGYFAHGYGARNSALGGAGVANADDQDTFAAATNPANMLYVGDGWDVDLTAFAPTPRSYTVTGGPAIPAFSGVLQGGGLGPGSPCAAPGMAPCQLPFSIGPQTIESSKNGFAIPGFGYNKMISDDTSIGVSVYGNGGMNTSYGGGTATVYNPQTDSIGPLPGTFGGGYAGVDLIQLFIAPTVAHKVGENSSIGISALVVVQLFEAYGLGNFAGISNAPDKLTNNGKENSYGLGAKVGFNTALTDSFRFAASYQTEIDMTEFDEYAGLFAERGNFDIPSTWSVGLAFNPSDTSTLMFDIQGINYGDIPAIANGMDALFQGQCLDALNATLFNGFMPAPASGPGCLGGSNGIGFGWDDMTIYKVGYQFSTGEDWTWRLGASTTDQPIGEDDVLFNILAPAVIKTHFTGGFTKALNNGAEVSGSFMYALGETVTGSNPFDPSQTISLEMDQYSLSVQYSKRY